MAFKPSNKLIGKIQATKPSHFLWPVFRYILLIDIAFLILFPFLVKISSALMSRTDIVDSTVMFVPRMPTLENFKLVLTFGKYWSAFFNTALYALICGILQTFVASMVGYSLAKFKFKGRGILFAMVVFTIIIPPQTIYISMFMKFMYFDIFGIFKALGLPQLKLLGNIVPVVILSATGLALKNGLYIFFMRQFFTGIPKELNEAALVDGSGPIRSFFYIMLPLSRSMLLSIFAISFAWQWTDTFYADLFYKSKLVLPNIVVLISQINSEGILQGTLMSNVMVNTAIVLIIAPVFIMYLFLQKYIIQGIERSGVVG